MSLVAYDASSDDETDSDNDVGGPKAIIMVKASAVKSNQLADLKDVAKENSQVGDDFVTPVENKEEESICSLSQLLPKPRNETSIDLIFRNTDIPTFSDLPKPQENYTNIDIEYDEVLHKKSNKLNEKNSSDTKIKKLPVKISIPCLKSFKDVEKERADKAKNKTVVGHSRSSVSSGLLSILPKAKSELNFAKVSANCNEDSKCTKVTYTAAKPPTPCFVPDTVKHKRPATNTEDVDRAKTNKNLHHQRNKTQVQDNKKADSDESDDDDDGIGDFFSFNSDKSLPNVSSTEINALVAKKAAKIAEATTKFVNKNESKECNNVENMQEDFNELETCKKRCQEKQLNPEALQALVGSSTKRRRQHEENIHIIDINSSQVLPNREEWMRTALASSTTYQPTGVLVDEEPATGTRRKHQITYLAHRAKANEAELQAMWSANRQNRRATQNKYGF